MLKLEGTVPLAWEHFLSYFSARLNYYSSCECRFEPHRQRIVGKRQALTQAAYHDDLNFEVTTHNNEEF
jgi:hypothetical protein